MPCVYGEQAQQILESMSDSFYAVDAEWRILYVNKRTEWYWKMKRSELLGRVIWVVFPEYTRIMGSQELMRAMANRTPVSFETFSPFLQEYIEVDAFPASSGGLEVYFRNITDRKLAAETQQITDQMLRLAIDVTSIGFWKWDIVTDNLHIIHSAPNLPPKWHDRPIGESFGDVHPGDRGAVLDALMAAKKNRAECKCEYRRILPDQSTLWIRAQGEFINGKDGAPYIIGTYQDITRQKRMELQEQLLREAEELKRREQELLEVLDSASDGSWIIDIPNGMQYSSVKWKTLRGLDGMTPAEEYAEDMKTVHPGDRDGVAAALEHACQNKLERCESEYRVKTAGSGYVWILSRIKIVYDGKGAPVKVYGAGTDITKRRELETGLKEKTRLLTSFFINVSNEFRTPLSIVLLALDLINRHFEETNCQHRHKMSHDLAVVRQNMFRMQKLFNNLLDLIKIDEGLMAVRQQTADITGTVRDLVDAAKPYATQKGISIQYIETCSNPSASVDVDKLERIMLNLLSNAIKNAQGNGQITVHLEIGDGRIRIAVTDNGKGIPPEMQEAIFGRFRPANTSMTRDSEGCGMGLSLARALAELMDGRVWVESTPGEGSTFTVELPAAEGAGSPACAVIEGFPLAKKVEMEFSDIHLE